MGCLRDVRPWSILGALTAAAALAVLGHTTPVEAADGPLATGPAPTAGITSIVAEALSGVGRAIAADEGDLVGAPRPGPRAVTGPDRAASGLLVPLRPTTVILRSALDDVGDTLPTPLARPVGIVAAALPETAPAPGSSVAVPGIGLPSSARLFAGESPVELSSSPTRPGAGAVPAETAAAAAQTASRPAPGPWSPISGGGVPAVPSLPPLPVNGPGSGGVAPAGGLGSPALAWLAILTILVALVASARARLGTPATLRSASFVTRTERPG